MTEAMPAMKTGVVHGGIGHIFNTLISEIGDPVDFELPDWLNKWQPAPFTFIKRNIYLTKKVKRRIEDDGISCSCNSTAGLLWSQVTGSSVVCGRECLCSMLMSGCSSGCKCASSCLNKPFHQRPVKMMKIVQTENCGCGIVADEDINKREFIIEYVGEVIDDKTCEERLWKMKHSEETNFYLCEINRDLVIDATYKGNKSRYINHSCSPNTEMQKWMIDGETRIGIFASRDIRRGEHLTYDYQFVQFGADQNCHCGAIKCRGKLGTKPNKVKLPSSDAALKLVARQGYQTGVPPKGSWSCESAQRIRHPRNCVGQLIIITRSFDRRYFGIIKQFDSITNKHLIMFEDGRVEYLDMSKESWEFCNFLV